MEIPHLAVRTFFWTSWISSNVLKLPVNNCVYANCRKSKKRSTARWGLICQPHYELTGIQVTCDYRLGEQADAEMDRYSPAGLEVMLFEASRDLM